ncbi:hypothetical protein OXX79_010002 [Metschnikowia pulcherrima]
MKSAIFQDSGLANQTRQARKQPQKKKAPHFITICCAGVGHRAAESEFRRYALQLYILRRVAAAAFPIAPTAICAQGVK